MKVIIKIINRIKNVFGTLKVTKKIMKKNNQSLKNKDKINKNNMK